MIRISKLLFRLSLGLVLFSSSVRSDVVIDGKIEQTEWQNAQTINRYIQSYPNTGEAPQYPTTTYLMSDEKGIYIAFKNFQPQRSRKYSGHDQFTSADFNMVFIDFNNDGDTAYEFVATLGGGTMDGTYSRGNQSSRDWDGNWQVQVSEQGDFWFSEFFIPWTTTSYKPVEGHERTIGVYFQRQNVIDSQAYSFPDTHRRSKNFTYEFHPVKVKNIQNHSVDTSAYVTMNRDVIGENSSLHSGVDLTWKPTANQQLIATIRPDFGQIESDELIVNYSAVETLRTDKRPFFTINQSLFDVQGPNSLKFVNTRRIGANAESRSDQTHDIDIAAKYVINNSRFTAGLLAAKENDVAEDKGKDFASLRWYSAINNLRFGQLFNWVSDPSNNRTSIVLNHDVGYQFDQSFNVTTNLIYSKINGVDGIKEGKGATLKASYVPARYWQNNLEWTYLDNNLDINDFGYMQRNNISSLTVNSQFDSSNFGVNSVIRSSRLFGKFRVQGNTNGVTLRDNFYLSYGLRLKSKHVLRGGYEQTNAGEDDLITRQVGTVWLPAQRQYYLYFRSPAPAPFTVNIRGDYIQEGEQDWAKKLAVNTTTYFTDTVRLNANFTHIDSDDWLIGNSQGQVERYRRRLNKVYTKLIARLNRRSDFTLTMQWYGLKAKGIDSISSSFSRGENFNTSQFALQARYRLRFKNGSKFYVVYSHNGFDNSLDFDEKDRISFKQLAINAFDSPTQKSITAKWHWVF